MDTVLPDSEIKQTLKFVITYKNANTECKRVIRSLRETGAPLND